jgi:hypothetical protein
MKIFGFEIVRAKTNIPDDQSFVDFINSNLTQCNNQLRGNINDKAKSYNEDILEYYFSQIMEKSIEFGINLEKQDQLNQKITK